MLLIEERVKNNMWFILGFLFIFIGYIVGTFGTAQVFSILRVAFPITFAIKKEHPNKKMGSLYFRYSFTILLWLGIMALITFLVYTHTKQIGYYLTGFLFAALFTIPNTGLTPQNESDFFRAYSRFFE